MFILLFVAAIVISNGYFILQNQTNRIAVDPAAAKENDNLPKVPEVNVNVDGGKVDTSVKN